MWHLWQRLRHSKPGLHLVTVISLPSCHLYATFTSVAPTVLLSVNELGQKCGSIKVGISEASSSNRGYEKIMPHNGTEIMLKNN